MTGARVRIPPSPPRKRDRICGLFFVLHKRRRDEKGTARLWREKNHPVNGFLVPRAGGGTAPVPPDESPYLHTKFHFEFHSFKEETLFIATPQSHFVRQLPSRGAFWGTLCAKIYELTLRLEQGRLTHCRSQFSLFLPVLRFALSATGGAQLRTSKREPFGVLYKLL